MAVDPAVVIDQGEDQLHTPAHFARKAAYRSAGRAMRAGGCLLPVAAFVVAAFYMLAHGT